jgi:predicted nicotinamide N-methyase
MPGYLTKQEDVAIAGVEGLVIRSLLNRQQYADPLGEADRVGISSAAWPLFGMLWPSGAHLAARIAARPVRAGERILEIGCGLALASLVGHRRGADVTASDCHPLAESFLQENLRLNGLMPMKYRHGRWGGSVSLDIEAPAQGGLWPDKSQDACIVAGHYDLIIGSDLLYERDTRGDLADFIACHAMPDAEIWIVDPDRGNRPAFHRHMQRQGFGCEEIRLGGPALAGLAAYKGRLLLYRRCRGPLLESNCATGR